MMLRDTAGTHQALERGTHRVLGGARPGYSGYSGYSGYLAVLCRTNERTNRLVALHCWALRRAAAAPLVFVAIVCVVGALTLGMLPCTLYVAACAVCSAAIRALLTTVVQSVTPVGQVAAPLDSFIEADVMKMKFVKVPQQPILAKSNAHSECATQYSPAP